MSTPVDKAVAQAVMSILDVVEEIAAEVARDPRWAAQVSETFADHRTAIREALS